MSSAHPVSSTSPHSKSTSAARSLTHPGILKPARETIAPGAVVLGPAIRSVKSVALDCWTYRFRRRSGLVWVPPLLEREDAEDEGG